MNPTAPLQTLELRTPLYDLSHLASAEVSFNYTFADVLCGYSLILQYSIDGGDQWQTLLQFEPHKYTHNDLVTNGEFRMALPKLSGRVCFKWETTVEFTRRAGAFAMDNFSITGVPVPLTVATLAFEVVDAEGAVQGASVSLQGVSGAQVTDAAGKASFAGLSLQSYTYTVSKAGYDDATGTVALAAGGVLEKVTLRKRVTAVLASSLPYVAIRPNPAKSTLFVENVEGVQRLRVVSLRGEELRLRLNKDRERVVSILLDGLSEGMYLLVVEGEGTRRVIPFVVVR